MTQNTNTAAMQRQNQQPQSLKSLLKDSLYQKRFEEILGKRAPQFVSSVLSVGTSLGADCEPTSIIASAMTAATLDLPVDKNLGFAWIVPYKSQGKKSAQFQMGYKGYIQLGLRTGQYERMNARVINAEAFQGWDEVGEPIIDWSKIDESEPSVGYVFAFKLVNGFTKIAYWPKERVEAHAKRYSQSYGGNYSSPWKSDFDAMALKTVIKNELAKWGILSIQMVTAIKHDQATRESLDAEPAYLDGTDMNDGGNELAPAPDVITEEQRTALVDLAQELGIVEKLGTVVNNCGFEMLAHITVDRYDEVETAVRNEAIPDAEIITDDKDDKPASSEPKLSKTESQRLNHIAWIKDFEGETVDNAERVAQVLGDGDLDNMSAGQVKDAFNALQAK